MTPVARGKPHYTNIFWIPAVHLAAAAAPFWFSWDGLALCLAGLFGLAPLGINVGYHRLLAHRSFEAPRWLRNLLATLGALAVGGPPLYWVALHRLHHRFSDTPQDPHDSRRGFWYAHVGHLFTENEHESGDASLRRYAPDLVGDRYLAFLNRYWLWFALSVLPVLYFAGGVSYVLWGGFARIALTWNVMWLVNSASHIWGYRNYETKDATVNCWWVGLLAAGEGWHNNHHAFPSSAAHGHRWWELDFSYGLICALERLGLARNVKRPEFRHGSTALAEAESPAN